MHPQKSKIKTASTKEYKLEGLIGNSCNNCLGSRLSQAISQKKKKQGFKLKVRSIRGDPICWNGSSGSEMLT